MNKILQMFRKEEGKQSLDAVAFFVFLLTVFLLPLFFIPFAPVSFQAAKGIILSLGALVTILLWLVARLRDGVFQLPRSPLFLAALFVPLVYFVASFFSPTPGISLFGRGFEIGSFTTVLLLMLFFMVIPLVVKNRRQVLLVFGAFFLSAAIVGVFQFLRLLVGTDFLSLGVFNSSVSNLVGKWNDLGVFLGLVIISILSTLGFLKRISPPTKIFLYVLLALSLFFLIVINFFAVWFVVGLFSLILFTYAFAYKRTKGSSQNQDSSNSASENNGPEGSFVGALVTFVLALIFVLSGGALSGSLTDTFNISHIEARPSFGVTVDIAKSALRHNPVFGVGPTRFANEWLQSKPTEVNSTIFWNTDFDSGVALIPSTLVTVGGLGFLAWALFIILFVITAFKSFLRSTSGNDVDKFISISTFVSALYLWVFSIIYIPNLVMLSFAFIFSGLFVAHMAMQKHLRETHIPFADNPRTGFVAVALFVILLTAGVSAGYFFVQRFASVVYFNSGINDFNLRGDLDGAEQKIAQAARLHGIDSYYRTLSQLNIARLNQVVSQTGVPQNVIQGQFQAALGVAIDNARQAIQYDETEYQNWLALGQIYETIVPANIQGAYENALSSYEQALTLNPKNPAILLIIARLELAHGDTTQARAYLEESLALKNNYTEAVFLLSQIEVSEGNIQAAIQSVEAASVISPNDPTVFFQLGLLYYNNNNFESAISALERAVLLSPTYSNAKYFLGLSYEERGRTEEAIQQFSDIEILNPGNQEVKLILQNLRDGLNPFANAEPPIDDTPEDRDTLPLPEEGDELPTNE